VVEENNKLEENLTSKMRIRNLDASECILSIGEFNRDESTDFEIQQVRAREEFCKEIVAGVGLFPGFAVALAFQGYRLTRRCPIPHHGALFRRGFFDDRYDLLNSLLEVVKGTRRSKTGWPREWELEGPKGFVEILSRRALRC
jgi:hypothetical protein